MTSSGRVPTLQFADAASAIAIHGGAAGRAHRRRLDHAGLRRPRFRCHDERPRPVPPPLAIGSAWNRPSGGSTLGLPRQRDSPAVLSWMRSSRCRADERVVAEWRVLSIRRGHLHLHCDPRRPLRELQIPAFARHPTEPAPASGRHTTDGRAHVRLCATPAIRRMHGHQRGPRCASSAACHRRLRLLRAGAGWARAGVPRRLRSGTGPAIARVNASACSSAGRAWR